MKFLKNIMYVYRLFILSNQGAVPLENPLTRGQNPFRTPLQGQDAATYYVKKYYINNSVSFCPVPDCPVPDCPVPLAPLLVLVKHTGRYQLFSHRFQLFKAFINRHFANFAHVIHAFLTDI